MFDHVVFGVSDYAAAREFFLKALEPLGVAVVSEGPHSASSFAARRSTLPCAPSRWEKATHLHLAFTAERSLGKSENFYRGRLSRRGAKTMVRLVCARSTTRTTMPLSSLVRTGTTSKRFAMNPRPSQSRPSRCRRCRL